MSRENSKNQIEKTLAIAFVLVGLWMSSSFVASKIYVTKQVLPKDRQIASAIDISWFKKLAVDISKPNIEKGYKYENINGQDTVTAPWMYDETGVYFLRALLKEDEGPFVQLYVVIESDNWLFLDKAIRLASNKGAEYLDTTPLDRQFTCHKTLKEEKCIFEHIGINFQDFQSFKEEANLDGDFKFVLYAKSPLGQLRNGSKVQKKIPRNYLRNFVKEVDPYAIRAAQQQDFPN